MTARYQYGDLRIRPRKKGPDVWQFRYFDEKGDRVPVLIGTIEKLPTRAEAERAVEHFRMKINSQNPQQQFHRVTVGGLIDRFMAEYAPKHCRLNTQKCYRGAFDKHVRPRWGNEFVDSVRTMAVQDWLDNYPHSRQVKAHIRRYLHILFNQAVRWELLDRNPITLVQQSGKRLKTPRALSLEEFKAYLAELREPHKTMVLVATGLGLRACELLVLIWSDIDFERLTISIQRSIVAGEINSTKTTASERVLPLDPGLAEILLQHKARSTFTADTDFVFAGPTGKWLWKDGLLAVHLKPAAVRAKIGNVGWHTLRHTYRAMLKRNGTALEVQKELMRHSDLKILLTYGAESEVTPANREANSRVVQMLLGN